MTKTRKRPPTSAEVQRALRDWERICEPLREKRPQEPGGVREGEEKNKANSNCGTEPTTAQTSDEQEDFDSCAKRAAISAFCHGVLPAVSVIRLFAAHPSWRAA